MALNGHGNGRDKRLDYCNCETNPQRRLEIAHPRFNKNCYRYSVSVESLLLIFQAFRRNPSNYIQENLPQD